MILSAGVLRREYPNMLETNILIKAMEIANIPKFLEYDLPLFNNILHDLFPKLKFE